MKRHLCIQVLIKNVVSRTVHELSTHPGFSWYKFYGGQNFGTSYGLRCRQHSTKNDIFQKNMCPYTNTFIPLRRHKKYIKMYSDPLCTCSPVQTSTKTPRKEKRFLELITKDFRLLLDIMTQGFFSGIRTNAHVTVVMWETKT